MPPRPALFAALLFAGTLPACTTTRPSASCGDGMHAGVEETLYFGTQRPGGVVSDEEWARFVEDIVAAAFPAGFTTWPAQGAWRGQDGVLVREGSHVLRVLRAGDAGSANAIQRVAGEYRRRFDQEAVLHVATPACVSP